MKRNPLSPEAYKDDSAACMLVRPPGCGLPFDDRSGVHVTDNWGLALKYALYKALKSESVAIVLTYDISDLELEPDFDAKVEQKHSTLSESSWYIEEFDIMEDPDNPDYNRLADLLENVGNNYEEEWDGPPWSVEDALHRGAKTPIEIIIADALRGDEDEARAALEEVAVGIPSLEHCAMSISQWRTFEEVGDERLLRVEVVKPLVLEVGKEDYEDIDEDECPMRLTLDDIDDIPSVVERVVLWERKEPRNSEVYYHGTDLTRAEQILEGTNIELFNPWAPCVQSER